MPYKCKAQYYFELNFNPREKWSMLDIPKIHNNNLLQIYCYLKLHFKQV